ncbi:MAG: preprotein translocase subunit YajC [Eubacterium sp.]|nr:preprotein translocase subunit YajC [Eubacterium sp.]
MNTHMILSEGAAVGGGNGGGAIFIIGYVAFLLLIVYFLFIKPSKKQRKEQEELMNSIKPGDTIMTTSGFYGTVIGMDDDTVIVEFGNNKNCRIPMHKKAIAEVEKPEEAVKEDAEEEKSSKKIGKKKEN